MRASTLGNPAPNRTKRPRAAAAQATADPQDTPSAEVLGDSLGYAIKRAQVRTYEVYFRTIGTAGLPPARMTALMTIGAEPSISQADLAARLKISGPSMVKVIDALETQGLVQRQSHANDRRRYALVPTDKGRAKLRRIRELVDAYEEEIAAGLSAAERRQLMQLLEKVAPETR